MVDRTRRPSALRRRMLPLWPGVRSCDDHTNDKKRKVPRVTMISPAIVSDDSLSSAQSNLSTTINNNNIPLVEGAGVESSVGPRLKRLKLRLNTDS